MGSNAKIFPECLQITCASPSQSSKVRANRGVEGRAEKGPILARIDQEIRPIRFGPKHFPKLNDQNWRGIMMRLSS